MSCCAVSTCLRMVAQLGEAEVDAWQAEHADEIDALVTELKTAKDGRSRHERSSHLPQSLCLSQRSVPVVPPVLR